jgi:hypothetical protein
MLLRMTESNSKSTSFATRCESARKASCRLLNPISMLAITGILSGAFVAPCQAPSTTAASAPSEREPLAIVPIEAANRDQAQVVGALQISNGTAFITTSGTVTSGTVTTNVVLPHRGVLRVCASTAVHLSADSSVPVGEKPGLMMALERGAVEASFATGRNSDVLLTPDFRILIGGPGAADVKVRLGQHGDTCVDNAGANAGADAAYVVVSSVFDGGAYRVQSGQRVMFQHGSLQEVVDHEKEPCGCPPAPRPNSNDFPLAESAGLAPPHLPVPEPKAGIVDHGKPQISEPLVYTAPAATPPPAPASPVASATPTQTPVNPIPPPAPEKKRGVFHRFGGFFKRIFGAE